MKNLLAVFICILAFSSSTFACEDYAEGAIITCGQIEDTIFTFNEDGTNIVDENDYRYYTIII